MSRKRASNTNDLVKLVTTSRYSLFGQTTSLRPTMWDRIHAFRLIKPFLFLISLVTFGLRFYFVFAFSKAKQTPNNSITTWLMPNVVCLTTVGNNCCRSILLTLHMIRTNKLFSGEYHKRPSGNTSRQFTVRQSNRITLISNITHTNSWNS